MQNDIYYDEILEELKPDYVVHGDNWKTGYQAPIREAVIQTLKKWGGQLVEYPYYEKNSLEVLNSSLKDKLGFPETRRQRLKYQLQSGELINAIEVHDGLSALIAEYTSADTDEGIKSFDAMWVSSLCDSTVKGKPDIELVDLTSRLQTVDEILEVKISSTKSQEKRKIKDLKKKLKAGDLLIATELSRLGRSMLEIINLVLELNDNQINFLFLRQIELSNFNNPSSKLILSIYAYLAENERELISKRTKAGLENARINGKILGRPKGTLKSVYDKDIEKIKVLLDKKLSIASIWKLLYSDSGRTYDGLLWFIKKRKLK